MNTTSYEFIPQMARAFKVALFFLSARSITTQRICEFKAYG